MSNSESPELEALRRLEETLSRVADVTATWRRRALTAESAVHGQGGVVGSGEDAERIAELESENHELRVRLSSATEKLDDLLKRLQFLEEQMQTAEETR